MRVWTKGKAFLHTAFGIEFNQIKGDMLDT